MKRRAFLELLAAAPIAALAPWRPPALEHYHWRVDVAARGPWFVVWSVGMPPFVVEPWQPPAENTAEVWRASAIVKSRPI